MNSKEFLIGRARRFFARYSDELASVRHLLQAKLETIALAYTLNHNLPKEAIVVKSRVKSLDSFLTKWEAAGFPEFYYLTEVARDLIGARVVCWFLDDCYGFLELMRQASSLSIHEDDLKDYIRQPKASGYRSIHLLVDVDYDRIEKKDGGRVIVPGKMVSEVQVRTKLQDAWGDFTHEVHYKVPNGFEHDFEVLVSEISNRLASEDRSVLAVRNLLQKRTETKEHEGLKS